MDKGAMEQFRLRATRIATKSRIHKDQFPAGFSPLDQFGLVGHHGAEPFFAAL